MRIADYGSSFSAEICCSGRAFAVVVEHDEHPLPQPDFLPARASQARRRT